MSPFGLTFSQMILHTETSKLMYNWSFLFVVLHKPTLLPNTFKVCILKSYNHFFLQNISHCINNIEDPHQVSWFLVLELLADICKLFVLSELEGSYIELNWMFTYSWKQLNNRNNLNMRNMNFKNRRNNKKPRGLKGEVLLQSTCIQFLYGLFIHRNPCICRRAIFLWCIIAFWARRVLTTLNSEKQKGIAPLVLDPPPKKKKQQHTHTYI